MENESTDRQQMLRDALGLLKMALHLLDRAAAPPEIGARIDHGIHQLTSVLGTPCDDIELSRSSSGATPN